MEKQLTLIEVTMSIELINIINELEKRISILEHRLDTGLRELPPDHVDCIPTIPGNAKDFFNYIIPT